MGNPAFPDRARQGQRVLTGDNFRHRLLPTAPERLARLRVNSCKPELLPYATAPAGKGHRISVQAKPRIREPLHRQTGALRYLLLRSSSDLRTGNRVAQGAS